MVHVSSVSQFYGLCLHGPCLGQLTHIHGSFLFCLDSGECPEMGVHSRQDVTQHDWLIHLFLQQVLGRSFQCGAGHWLLECALISSTISDWPLFFVVQLTQMSHKSLFLIQKQNKTKKLFKGNIIYLMHDCHLLMSFLTCCLYTFAIFYGHS